MEADNVLIDSLAKRLGGLIKSERERLGLHQADIANMIGVTQTAVSTWELAQRHAALQLPVLFSLEDAFALPRWTLVERLAAGALADQVDFEAVVLGDKKLTPRQKEALIQLHRAMTMKD